MGGPCNEAGLRRAFSDSDLSPPAVSVLPC